MTNKSISYYNGNSSIKPTYNIGNLDQDPEIEFVSLSNYLLQFDNNLELLQTDSLRYSAYSLFDWDKDGDLDIVAAYYTSGFGAISGIRILDESSNVLKDFPLGNNILINSVEVTDINKDGINELVCAANNILYFINSEDGTFSKGDLNLRSVGQYQAIEMIDYDNDGTLNLFLGSYHTITELDLDCAQCLWYEASLQKDDSKCSENNGKLIGQSSDSNTIFNIENDTLTFVDSLNGLSAGYYKVIASNNQMCSLEFEFDINQFDLKAQINSENLKCFGDNDGQIEVIVTEGANPIEFDWSNGSNTNQIDSLSSGLYIINITDSLNCKIQDSIEITSPEKLSATFVLYQQDDPDTPEGEGSIGTFVSGGAFPYQFLWSTGETNFIIRNLEANSYSLKIIDENNCELDTFAVVDYTTNVENLTDAIAKIYPNPTNGYVQIEAKENLYFDQYQIFAINGQLIKTGKINSLNKQVELDLSDLISGEYLLLLSVGNKNYQTIIKKI